VFYLTKKQNSKNDDKKNSDGNDIKKFGLRRMKSKVGTLYYISPEIIKGNYDEKCDIWACGVILYILLCGYPPFNGNTDKEVYNLITQVKYDFDKEKWKNISKYARDLIKNMLTPAKNRYTAKQVLASKWLEIKLKDNTDEKTHYILDYKHINKYKNFNKFKHSIILVKSEYTDILKNEKFTYYKNVYYNKDINEAVNGITNGEPIKNIEPLLNELFVNYPKMIIYSQIITTDLNPSVENNSYLIVKKEDDNDLNIIECCMNKNKIQNENKLISKKERKARKNKIIETETEKNTDLTSTVSIMNDLMIMDNGNSDNSIYTQDMLNTKNHAELRQIAKTYKIKLSYVLENGDRKNKTRKELIQEILEKNKE